MISPPAVKRLKIDILQLSSFVSSLSLPDADEQNPHTGDHPSILRRTVDELTQTVDLMASANPEEFYDIAQRNKKFESVNAQNGAMLLEKVERGKAEVAEREANAAQQEADRSAGLGLGAYGARAEEARQKLVGNVMRGFRKGE